VADKTRLHGQSSRLSEIVTILDDQFPSIREQDVMPVRSESTSSLTPSLR